MVCLVRPADQPILPVLAADYLGSARPGRIPHALYRCADDPLPDVAPGDLAVPVAPDEVAEVRDILLALSRELVSGRNSRFGRMRFRRLGLACWLMDQALEPGMKDPDRLLRERLRERDIVVRPDERILAATTETVSSVVTIPQWGRRLLSVIPPLWFSVKVSGRVPGISSSYRWFLRGQPNLAPHDPGTFVGFAERLTRENYGKEDPEQVMRLLVNAFLEDLRRAYGKWPWRLRGARRMTYAVVLLDGITRRNGGYRLLELINDVRNETGAFDPLLVISGSRKVPPYAAEPGTGPNVTAWDACNAELGYEAWRNQLSRNSRRRASTAWYLPIRVPTTDVVVPEEPSDAAQPGHLRAYQELAAVEEFSIDRPPLWSHRWVPTLVVAALAATLGVVVLADRAAFRAAHCNEPRGSADARWLVTAAGECVGVSDGEHVFEPTNARLADVERKVHEQNLKAVQLHRDNPARPFVDLIYVAGLTSSTSELVTARERLEGVAVAQSLQLDATGQNEPIIRILIANGGAGMRHGKQMTDVIIRLADADPSIVGVVGLDQSRLPTFEAIRAISQAGLPMIAASLSADALVESSSLYFQVSPQNKREAAVAVRYVTNALKRRGGTPSTRPAKRRVQILASADRDDIYSQNLTEDARQVFGEAGFTVDPPLYFNPQGLHLEQPSAKTLAERTCAYPGLIFFTGRQEDFEDLLHGYNTECQDSPPWIMGDDDVAKYVADRKKREELYSAIPYDYLAFTVGSGSGCGRDDAYRRLKTLFPEDCGADRDPSLDGAMELAYDATQAMILAVSQIRQDHLIRVSAGGVWRQLSQLAFNGESGRIDFRTGLTHVPQNKPVAVLRVVHGQHPKPQGFCGQRAGQRQYSWCPTMP